MTQPPSAIPSTIKHNNVEKGQVISRAAVRSFNASRVEGAVLGDERQPGPRHSQFGAVKFSRASCRAEFHFDACFFSRPSLVRAISIYHAAETQEPRSAMKRFSLAAMPLLSSSLSAASEVQNAAFDPPFITGTYSRTFNGSKEPALQAMP
jgi:hypothetical protein